MAGLDPAIELSGRVKPGHDVTGAVETAERAYRSTHMAMPMPPPMQSVARPFLAPRRFIS